MGGTTFIWCPHTGEILGTLTRYPKVARTLGDKAEVGPALQEHNYVAENVKFTWTYDQK